MEDYSTLIPDELLRIVTPLIPVSQWRRTAYEAFNLTVNEVDAIESAPARCDVIFHLLHRAVQRDQMPTQLLVEKIEDARKRGVRIGWTKSDSVTSVELPSGAMLHEISSKLMDYEMFLVGYMGYTFEEIAIHMHNTSDYKACVLKMLSLWRCKDDKVKTIDELLSALEMGSELATHIVKSAVKEWATRSDRSSIVTLEYMQTVMPVSNLETIQGHLKSIYTNTLSTLCPLPWLEEAANAHFSFDEVFIPLRTTDVRLLQKTVDTDHESNSDGTLVPIINKSTRQCRKRKRGRSVRPLQTVGQHSDPHSESSCVSSMNDLLVIGVEKKDVTKPRCILVESVAGGGKSTLCQRVAYQWAKNCPSIQRLHSFSLVFLIKTNLISIDDKSIFDYILRELLPGHNNIADIINNLGLLFIVDGYDELSGNTIVIEDLLAKRVCPQSTVVVTTRDGQTPPLQYFSNGFRIHGLSSRDVQYFLSKLPRNTENRILTKIDLDVHPLGSILSTPLFLWFYYLLGEETFKEINGTSRTNLFMRIIDGIQQKAVQRLHKTETHCSEAIIELEQLAYNCLCKDKLHFDKYIGELASNIGLVKQTKSHLHLRKYTTYTFTHKSLAEYLAARFVSKSHDIIHMLEKIPEVKDRSRRKASLILYFVCGLTTNNDMLFDVFNTFVPRTIVNSPHHQSHVLHFNLQCIAELPDILIDTFVKDRIRGKVEMLGHSCTQYCVLGIKRACETNCYTLEELKMIYKGEGTINMLGDPINVNAVIRSATKNILGVYGEQSPTLWATLHNYYREVKKIKLYRCAGPMPSTFCPDILLEYHDCDGEFICDQLSSRDSRCVEIVGNKLDYTWQDSDTVVLRDVFKNRLLQLSIQSIIMTTENVSDVARFISISKLTTLKLWDIVETDKNGFERSLLSSLLPKQLCPSLQQLCVLCKTKDDLDAVTELVKQCPHLVTFGCKWDHHVWHEPRRRLWETVIEHCIELEHIQLFCDCEQKSVKSIRQVISARSLKQRRKLKLRTLSMNNCYRYDITHRIADLLPVLQQ